MDITYGYDLMGGFEISGQSLSSDLLNRLVEKNVITPAGRVYLMGLSKPKDLI